ncbi:hypothetical protein A6U97_08040 [Agrobacterium tumefaciens]|uniref:terminase TerL endonuclease subunit n=1 Tax=Agrobacterium tumefaciens TaxID=358 RepID=UPI00080FE6A8|nr:hypothetical protein A6U97_08040 [Agrobacterium tumefaciens]
MKYGSRLSPSVRETASREAETRAEVQAAKLPEVGAVGLDPNGVTALLEELAGYSIIDPMVKAVSQGYKLSASIFGIERKLADGTMKHCGSGLLTWCVQNACAEQRGSNIYIDKKTASSKIDPLVAAFNAGELKQ